MRNEPSKLALFACLAALGAGTLTGCGTPGGTIGAMLGQRGDGRLFVRETPPALAASRSGLEEGDEILLIDGRDVRQMNERQVHAALSGNAGSQVKITVIRGDAVVRATLTRSEVPRRRAK